MIGFGQIGPTSLLVVLGVFILLSIILGQAAQVPELAVGSLAPPIQAAAWFKGSPVLKFRKGQVYVIDFWATWCPPCVASMPHLAELQRTCPNVSVIAMTAPDDYGNDEKAVRAFVKENAKMMGFGVAWDKSTVKGYQGVFRGKTAWSYLGGARAQAIPTTFVVDQRGRIAYIGLPTMIDETLAAVMKGDFDLDQAAARYRERKAAEPKIQKICKLLDEKKYSEAYALARPALDGPLLTDPRAQWLVADRIVSFEGEVLEKDLDLALRAAVRAGKACNFRDPAVLRTLAGVHHFRGEAERAKELMERAIKLSIASQRAELEKVKKQMLG